MALIILFPLFIISFIYLWVYMIRKNREFTKDMSPEDREAYYEALYARVHGKSTSTDFKHPHESMQTMINLGYYDSK